MHVAAGSVQNEWLLRCTRQRHFDQFERFGRRLARRHLIDGLRQGSRLRFADEGCVHGNLAIDIRSQSTAEIAPGSRAATLLRATVGRCKTGPFYAVRRERPQRRPGAWRACWCWAYRPAPGLLTM